jgi:hypothetical protein
MKKIDHLFSVVVLATVLLAGTFVVSCDDDDDSIDASVINIDGVKTEKYNIGDTIVANIKINSEAGIESLKVEKIVDEEVETTIDLASLVTKNNNEYTYKFTHVLSLGEDLKTLAFRYTLVDNQAKKLTKSFVIGINMSVPGYLVKYDWKGIKDEGLNENNELTQWLAPHDADDIFRFNLDGTYTKDLGETLDDFWKGKGQHFCNWVYKQTPNNGDTLGILRLVRRAADFATGKTEHYDYKILSINENEFKAVYNWWFFLDYTSTKTFQKVVPENFVDYGQDSLKTAVMNTEILDCAKIDESVLTIE